MSWGHHIYYHSREVGVGGRCRHVHHIFWNVWCWPGPGGGGGVSRRRARSPIETPHVTKKESVLSKLRRSLGLLFTSLIATCSQEFPARSTIERQRKQSTQQAKFKEYHRQEDKEEDRTDRQHEMSPTLHSRTRKSMSIWKVKRQYIKKEARRTDSKSGLRSLTCCYILNLVVSHFVSLVVQFARGFSSYHFCIPITRDTTTSLPCLR